MKASKFTSTSSNLNHTRRDTLASKRQLIQLHDLAEVKWKVVKVSREKSSKIGCFKFEPLNSQMMMMMMKQALKKQR